MTSWCLRQKEKKTKYIAVLCVAKGKQVSLTEAFSGSQWTDPLLQYHKHNYPKPSLLFIDPMVIQTLYIVKNYRNNVIMLAIYKDIYKSYKKAYE